MSVQMREAIITMAASEFDNELAADKADLTAHREARRRREELAREAGIAKLTEGYIDALYYFEKWASPACWQTAKQADAELLKLKSRSAKVAALKEQIRIRVLGLGWSDLATAWSKAGKELTVPELHAHLNTIIAQQRTRAIPSKPPVPALERKRLPSLGKRTVDVAILDAAEASSTVALEQAARATTAQREAEGVGDSVQERQPVSAPVLDAGMVGKRVEVLFPYNVPGGAQELLWCAGEIVFVADGTNLPRSKFEAGKAAMVRWDANAQHDELVSESPVRLLPTRWNKSIQGAWRFDLVLD